MCPARKPFSGFLCIWEPMQNKHLVFVWYFLGETLWSLPLPIFSYLELPHSDHVMRSGSYTFWRVKQKAMRDDVSYDYAVGTPDPDCLLHVTFTGVKNTILCKPLLFQFLFQAFLMLYAETHLI